MLGTECLTTIYAAEGLESMQSSTHTMEIHVESIPLALGLRGWIQWSSGFHLNSNEFIRVGYSYRNHAHVSP